MKISTILFATSICITSHAASAVELKPWGKAGGWDVMIDPTLGNGCLIQAFQEKDSIVRIGFDRNLGFGYVTTFAEAWSEVEIDKHHPITFSLDGEKYIGEIKGQKLDGTPGVDITFDDPSFLVDIAKKYTMTIYSENKEIMAIDLAGALKGYKEMTACQEEMG